MLPARKHSPLVVDLFKLTTSFLSIFSMLNQWTITVHHPSIAQLWYASMDPNQI